jgi:polyhydroxybutyrate depolymerase
VTRTPPLQAIGVVFCVGLAGGCGFGLDRCGPAAPGQRVACPMPGWLDRPFDLLVPASWDGGAALPLIYGIHGGGGNHTATNKLTCPHGMLGDPGCLSEKATSIGFALVIPNGTGTRPVRNVRTWNAGGGADGWLCVSGPACKAGVDDMRYFDDLHAEVGRLIPIDARRVYATGISNGGAMTHRLACAWTTPLAAAAPVGGANQWAAAGGACAGGTPILQIHGTADPCWRFEESTATCATLDEGRKAGVTPTIDGWRGRNGCPDAPPTVVDLPDADPNDGTTSRRETFAGCAADVELIRIEGGGHTWPQGDPYLPTDVVGPVAQDFDADDVILEFFGAHVRP